MLCDTTVVVAVVVVAAVVRTRPRAIPLAKITMRKSTHGFPLISIYGLLMGLRLAALRAAGAPLLLTFFCLKHSAQFEYFSSNLLPGMLDSNVRDLSP